MNGIKAASVRKYWFDNDAVRSSVFNGSSAIIPLLEYFVVDTVKDVLLLLEGTNMARKAQDLLHEEKAHISVHERYNQMLRDSGYNLTRVLTFGSWFLGLFRYGSLRSRLALCACGEYFTTLMAKHTLENGMFVDRGEVDERVRRVWIWHSLEEIHHRGTIFDIYTQLHGGYVRRILMILCASLFIGFLHTWATLSLLSQDKKLFQYRVLRDTFLFMFGPKGCYSSVFLSWLLFFKIGFHPSQLPIDERIIHELHHRHIEDKLLVGV